MKTHSARKKAWLPAEKKERSVAPAGTGAFAQRSARQRHLASISARTVRERVKEGDAASMLDEFHWIRKSALLKGGYANISIDGRNQGAHRAALAAFLKRPLEREELVLHRCRRRDCCDPKHLYSGTAQDNANDRRRDGTLLLGEQNPRAKLSDAVVAEIVLLEQSGESAKALAEKYEVNRNTIYQYVRNARERREKGQGAESEHAREGDDEHGPSSKRRKLCPA